MHLVSLEKQSVTISGAGCYVDFEPGETIWTESSQKFDSAELVQCANQTGFIPLGQWIDREWPFAEKSMDCRRVDITESIDPPTFSRNYVRNP